MRYKSNRESINDDKASHEQRIHKRIYNSLRFPIDIKQAKRRIRDELFEMFRNGIPIYIKDEETGEVIMVTDAYMLNNYKSPPFEMVEDKEPIVFEEVIRIQSLLKNYEYEPLSSEETLELIGGMVSGICSNAIEGNPFNDCDKALLFMFYSERVPADVILEILIDKYSALGINDEVIIGANNDPYSYKHLNMLISKFGIYNREVLDEAERWFTTVRIGQMSNMDFPISLDGFKAIHRHIFGDIYKWAGDCRLINMSKNFNRFMDYDLIDKYLARVCNNINIDKSWHPEDIFDYIGEIIGNLNIIHPFREGNGRTMREFAKILAQSVGFDIDISFIDADRWMNASKYSFIKADGIDLGRVLYDARVDLQDYIYELDIKNLTPLECEKLEFAELQHILNKAGREDPHIIMQIIKGLREEHKINKVNQSPILFIIAGPNGAGKSTFTRAFNPKYPIIDADNIMRNLDAEEAEGLEAAKQAIKFAKKYILHGKSFIQETTLSGNYALKLMQYAKASGYRVELFYIGLSDAKLAELRIKERTATGGHDILPEDINRRYERCLINLDKARRIADMVTIYDNSGTEIKEIPN